MFYMEIMMILLWKMFLELFQYQNIEIILSLINITKHGYLYYLFTKRITK